MEHIQATIISNREIAEGYHELLFTLPANATSPLPGQFLTIRVDDANVPLLRRPFAFSSWSGETHQAGIIYQKRGNATAILSGRDHGDSLDILSPLGNFFPSPSPVPMNSPTPGHTDGLSPVPLRRPVLLAGGIGMGPMFFLADEMRRQNLNPLLLVGARQASLIPEMPEYSKVETLIATDDGSRGYRGNIIQALDYYAKKSADVDQFELYACGPNVMMKAAHLWTAERNLPLWVSMEQTMGCAVGACMGCVVEVTDERKYARVCSEGPIFPSEVIKWQ